MKRLTWGLVISLCIVVSLFCGGISFAAGQILWKVDFSSQEKSEKIKVNLNDCWDAGDYLRLYTKDSYVSIFFTLEKGDYKGYTLQVTDRGTNVKMESAQDHSGGVVSPCNIVVNGVTIADHIDITWTDFKTASFDVGKYLKNGENLVSIKMQVDAKTRYDLKDIVLVKK